MGIASIARYSLAMIQRLQVASFAGGYVCRQHCLRAAVLAGDCVCGWLCLRVAMFESGRVISPNRMPDRFVYRLGSELQNRISAHLSSMTN